MKSLAPFVLTCRESGADGEEISVVRHTEVWLLPEFCRTEVMMGLDTEDVMMRKSHRQ